VAVGTAVDWPVDGVAAFAGGVEEPVDDVAGLVGIAVNQNTTHKNESENCRKLILLANFYLILLVVLRRYTGCYLLTKPAAKRDA